MKFSIKFLTLALALFFMFGTFANGQTTTTQQRSMVEKSASDKNYKQHKRMQRHKHKAGDMPNRTPEEIAQKRTTLMTKKLDLSQDQSNKVYGILLDYNQKIRDIRSKARESEGMRQAYQREIRHLKRDQKQTIYELLNPQQQATLDEMRAKRKANYKDAETKERIRKKRADRINNSSAE